MHDESEQSGVLPIFASDDAPTVDDGCHQIIDAAAALQTNVEMLAEMARDLADSESVVADMRASVDRIVAVARALRGGHAQRKIDYGD